MNNFSYGVTVIDDAPGRSDDTALEECVGPVQSMERVGSWAQGKLIRETEIPLFVAAILPTLGYPGRQSFKVHMDEQWKRFLVHTWEDTVAYKNP